MKKPKIDSVKIDCGWYGELEFSKYELKKLKEEIDKKLKS